MKIDISDLTNKKVAKKELHLIIEDKGFYDGVEFIEFEEPAKFDGTLSLLGNIITLEGQLKCELKLICSRCLQTLTYPIEVYVEEKFSTDEANKDDEIIFLDGDNIDITEVIENNIILALPMKRLCREDCKGLCQICGNNLNSSSCDCGKDDIDPRLAKLKDLFSTD